MERKAQFNALRMHWIRNSGIPVENWQVEDYRNKSLNEIFSRLERLNVHLDKVSFASITDEIETPEQLSDLLAVEANSKDKEIDEIYLLVFELWRRLVPEKQTLSLFCDELDYQIDFYERGFSEHSESLENALSNFAALLEENSDLGENPKIVFKLVSQASAHDLESFLYDFIIDQIENKNESYASELLEDFMPYVSEENWFKILQARILLIINPIEGDKLIHQLVKISAEQKSVSFNLDLLSLIINAGDKSLFSYLIQQTIPMIANEEELQDLLSICADFFQFNDLEKEETTIQKMIKNRAGVNFCDKIEVNNQHLNTVKGLFTHPQHI